MLLAIDIGNTNIVIGLWQDDFLLGQWRISTDAKKTEDEYKILIQNIIELNYELKKINKGIISSVVPQLNRIFDNVFKQTFGVRPLFVTPDIKLGLGIKYPNKYEIGADRLVNAAAVVHYYEPPAIIIDFGTATTFCFVDKHKKYHGGLILPGLSLMLKALHLGTAKLPAIDIARPNNIIGHTTIESIQSGIFYQTIGAVNFIVNLLKTKYDESAIVIITGGISELFEKEFSFKNIIDANLTLKGLKVIFQLNMM